jgi:HEAT repeat protein
VPAAPGSASNTTAPAPYVAPAAAPTIRASGNVIPASNQTTPQTDALVRQLSDATDTVRRDAALELGRMKAASAIDALTNVLQKDASPIARDGAARGLGLIGSPQSLRALIYAAQADNDREVRHSAQFAVQVIRENLRGN